MSFEIRKSYNFTVYTPGLFIDSFRRMKVLALVTYEVAKQYANVDLIQRQIYPQLPPGTPDRVSQYTFVLFESPSGNKTVLADYWIVSDSIQEVTAVNLEINVYDVSTLDTERIRDALLVMGMAFDIKEVDI